MAMVKHPLVDCFILVLFIWAVSFLTFLAFFSYGHNDRANICEHLFSDVRDDDKYFYEGTNNDATKNSSLTSFDMSNVQVAKTRRNVDRGVTEMWFYLKSELTQLKKQTDLNIIQQKIYDILDMTSQQKNLILTDLQSLAKHENKWKIDEHNRLSQMIQTRLHELQNPKNCSKSRKLYCEISNTCGFGCKVHHLVYCLMMAYGTNRTLVVGNTKLHLWTAMFRPITTCENDEKTPIKEFNGADYKDPIIKLSVIGNLYPRPDFLPLAVPIDLATMLNRISGDPFVWWAGQFIKYILSPRKKLKRIYDRMTEKIEFKHPVVGVHIRRTDKHLEASFHQLDEYMTHVDEYFQQLEIKILKPDRRVYLASDDPEVFQEAKKRYPHYTFLGNIEISKSAAPEKRNSKDSILGIILDIHFLSHCDFIVCTFSSQVCRAAYELMQTMLPDGATNFRSLDDIYYFAGQSDHNFEAVLPHRAENKDEVDFQIGDSIHVLGNHWNGYSKGLVCRTKRVGLFPTFKIRDVIKYSLYGNHTIF